MEEKKPPLKGLLVVIGILVIFVVGFVTVQEYTLQTGQEVYLETMPVDPRDPLRGDYVILRYEIERNQKINDLVTTSNLQEGDTIYMNLAKDSKGVGTISSVSRTEPTTGLFIRGKIDKWNSIDLGIGKYFVPEGTGREIERVRSDMQVLTVIDKYGTAKIKSLYYEDKEINPDTFKAK